MHTNKKYITKYKTPISNIYITTTHEEMSVRYVMKDNINIMTADTQAQDYQYVCLKKLVKRTK